jgi:hypothetical protein
LEIVLIRKEINWWGLVFPQGEAVQQDAEVDALRLVGNNLTAYVLE